MHVSVFIFLLCFVFFLSLGISAAASLVYPEGSGAPGSGPRVGRDAGVSAPEACVLRRAPAAGSASQAPYLATALARDTLRGRI